MQLQLGVGGTVVPWKEIFDDLRLLLQDLALEGGSSAEGCLAMGFDSTYEFHVLFEIICFSPHHIPPRLFLLNGGVIFYLGSKVSVKAKSLCTHSCPWKSERQHIGDQVTLL